MVLPGSVVILTHLRSQAAAKTLNVPPMHAMVAMRAAAARAALGAGGSAADIEAAAAEAAPRPRPAAPMQRTAPGPGGFETLSSLASGG